MLIGVKSLDLLMRVSKRGSGRVSCFMSEESKKALVRRSWEAPDSVEECFTPPMRSGTCPTKTSTAQKEFKRYVSGYRTAFPDENVTVEDEIAEGEKGSSTASPYAAPTKERRRSLALRTDGRQMERKGMTISRIGGGKIVEEWQAYDDLSVMQQLGFGPER